MTKYRCNTCGGEYDDVQPDGTLYFHVCPPIPVHKVKRPDGTIVTIEGNVSSDQSEVVETTFRERPNKRDENVMEDRALGRVRIKAEGKGRMPLEAIEHARSL
jgi:ssDNA-binding Zn-finger/Zn-ribbon topoisomerase 1